MTECRIAGCEQEAEVKGMCNDCYAKVLRLYENRQRDQQQPGHATTQPKSPRALLQRSKTDNASNTSTTRGNIFDENSNGVTSPRGINSNSNINSSASHFRSTGHAEMKRAPTESASASNIIATSEPINVLLGELVHESERAMSESKMTGPPSPETIQVSVAVRVKSGGTRPSSLNAGFEPNSSKSLNEDLNEPANSATTAEKTKPATTATNERQYTARVPVLRSPPPIPPLRSSQLNARENASMGQESSTLRSSSQHHNIPQSAFHSNPLSALSPRATLLSGSHRGPLEDYHNHNNTANPNNNSSAPTISSLLSPRNPIGERSGFLLPSPPNPTSPPLSPREIRLRTVSANAETGKRLEAERVRDKERERAEKNANQNQSATIVPPLVFSPRSNAQPASQQHSSSAPSESTSSGSNKARLIASLADFRPSAASNARLAGQNLRNAEDSKEKDRLQSQLLISPRQRASLDSSVKTVPMLQTLEEKELTLKQFFLSSSQSHSDDYLGIPLVASPRSPPLSPRTRAVSADISAQQQKKEEAIRKAGEKEESFRALRSIQISQHMSSIERARLLSQSTPALAEYRGAQIVSNPSPTNSTAPSLVSSSATLSPMTPSLSSMSLSTVSSNSIDPLSGYPLGNNNANQPHVPNTAVGNNNSGGQSSPLLSPPRSPRAFHFDAKSVSKEVIFLLTQKLSRYCSEGYVVGVMAIVLHYPFLVYDRNFLAQTCLYCACREGHVAVAVELLKALPPNRDTSAAVIDAQDANGDTALHVAVHARKRNVVALLLTRGAKSNLANQHGYTARQIAYAMGGEINEVFLCLEKQGLQGLTWRYPIVTCLPTAHYYTLETLKSRHLIPEFSSFLANDERLQQYVNYYWNFYRYQYLTEFQEQAALRKTISSQYDALSKDFATQIKEESISLSHNVEKGIETKFISPFEKFNTVLVKVIENEFHHLYSFLETKDRADFSHHDAYMINLPDGGCKRIVIKDPQTNLMSEISALCEHQWDLTLYDVVTEEGIPLGDALAARAVQLQSGVLSNSKHKRPPVRVFLEPVNPANATAKPRPFVDLDSPSAPVQNLPFRPSQARARMLSREFTGGYVPTKEKAIPMDLFVVMLADGTKRTIKCSPDEQNLVLAEFLRLKKDQLVFTDVESGTRLFVHEHVVKDARSNEIDKQNTRVADISQRYVLLDPNATKRNREREKGLDGTPSQPISPTALPQQSSDGATTQTPQTANSIRLLKAIRNLGKATPSTGTSSQLGNSANAVNSVATDRNSPNRESSPTESKQQKRQSLEPTKRAAEKGTIEATPFGYLPGLTEVIAYTVFNIAESFTIHYRFLLVYKQWISSEVLLRRILQLFLWCLDIAKPRIFGFLEMWLSLYFADFTGPMLQQVREAFDTHREHSQNSITSFAFFKLLEQQGSSKERESTPNRERVLNHSANISGSSSNLLVRKMVVTGKGDNKFDINPNPQRASSDESEQSTPPQQSLLSAKPSQPQSPPEKEPSKAVRHLMVLLPKSPSLLQCVSVLRFDVVELAQQMTLYDQAQLLAVPREDFLNKSYANPEKSSLLHRLTVTFNLRTQWILTELIMADSTEVKQTLSHFILLAEKLFSYGNIHGFLCIILGLSQNLSSKLSAWKMLSFTVKSKWEHLSEDICNPSKNFRNLRHLFHSRSNPKISSPSLFVKDLTMLEEASPNWEGDECDESINLDKLNILSEIVYSVLGSVQSSYPFTQIDVVQEYLNNLFSFETPALEVLAIRKKIFESDGADLT